MRYLGFDIGGSSIKAVLVEDKKIIKSAVENLPGNLEALFAVIEKMKAELTSGLNERVGGVGFGIAGQLDVNRERILNSPNIGYLNARPIKKLLAEKMKPYQIKIEHDVNCFLLAEKQVGLAKNLKNVFYLTLGTGIGGAWMVDGKIYAGAHGAAGEAGHMIMDIGSKKDFEDLGSNKFIISETGSGSIETGSRALAGDRSAIEFLRKLGSNLGVGIANIINVFDPEAVILAGGIAESRDFLLSGIREGIDKFVTSLDAKKTQILFSQLGREGGALGAALLW